MAVSMNAGFMRSDYMISDAALPIRMEELEQTERFSKILGELGGAPGQEQIAETPDVQSMAQQDFSVEEQQTVFAMPDKTDVKALARAIVRGEIKLDEIPEELVSDILLQTIAAMMAEAPQEDEAVAEDCFAGVVPINAEMAQPEATDEATEQGSVQLPVQTEQENIPEAAVEVRQTEWHYDKHTENVAYTVNEAAQANTAEHIQHDTDKQEAPKTEPIKAAVPAEASAPQQTVSRTDLSSHQDSGTQQDSGTHQDAMQNTSARAADIPKPIKTDDLGEEFSQLKKAITDYSVKNTVPEKQNYDVQQLTVTDSTAKSRVVSKSDELMLLKNSAKPAADAEITPQSMGLEPPAAQPVVVFARADGTEVEVKPAEVVHQVVDDIITQAPAAEEGSTEYSVTLNPEDLGSITVKLTKTVDGSLSVSIMAENAKTQRIIEQNGAAIQQELRSNGIELAEWQTVGESQHENRAEDYNGSSKNPYYRGEDNSDSGDDEDNSFAELISAM